MDTFPISRAPDESRRPSAPFLTATILLSVAGVAFWHGGVVWGGFVVIIAVTTFWEWSRLAWRIASNPLARFGWLVAGALVLGFAALLYSLGNGERLARWSVALVVLSVVATGLGSTVGRWFVKGSQIAPRIYRETWSGLAGGMAASAGLFVAYGFVNHAVLGGARDPWLEAPRWVMFGGGLSLLAQAGRFFVSWMTQSGKDGTTALVPGGLLNQVGGLIGASIGFAIYIFARSAG